MSLRYPETARRRQVIQVTTEKTQIRQKSTG